MKVLVTLIYFVCFTAGVIIGQDLGDTDKAQFENERIEQMQPSSKKPNAPAPTPDLSVTRNPLKYTARVVAFNPQLEPIPLSPAPLPHANYDDFMNNYIKVGIGRFLTPLARVYIHNGINYRYDWGVTLHHFSTPNGHIQTKDGKNRIAAFGDNMIKAYGSYLMGKQSAYGKLQYQRFGFNFYGDSTALLENTLPDSLTGAINRVEFEAGFKRITENPNHSSFNLPFIFQLYSDRQNNAEKHFTAKPWINFRIVDSLRCDWSNQVTVSTLTYPKFWDGAQKLQFFVDVTPGLRYKIDALNLYGAFRFNSFTGADTSNFRVYPVIRASYEVAGKKFVPYLGLTGQTNYNTRYSLSGVNPYLSPHAAMAPSMERLRIYLGAQGAFNQFNYDVQFYRRNVEAMPVFFSPVTDKFFDNRRILQGEFTIRYEHEFIETGSTIQMNYDYGQKVRTGARLDFSSYSLKTVKHYYQMPTMRMTFFGSVMALKKLQIFGQAHVIGNRPMGLDHNGKVVEQPTFVDLGLEAQYIFAPKFSVFLEGNNLLNATYYRWNYYLERPFDIRAGVTYSF